MVTDIQPGADLDLAVARAIGITTAVSSTNLPWRPSQVFISHREWDEIRGIGHPTCEGDLPCMLFAPSTDLNTAFAAAEKVSGYVVVMKNENSNGCWEAKVNPRDRWDEWSRESTPALAICAAILKEKA